MRKYSFPLFFLVLGMICLFVANLSAQNKVSVDNDKSLNVGSYKSLQNYIDISSLPMNKRPKVFSDLSAEDKADLFRLHLALQIVKRPNLTQEQKNVILESLSSVTPESYDRENSEKRLKAQQEANLLEQKARSAFPGQEGFEIFASLGGNQEDIEMLQKYVNIANLPTIAQRKKSFGQYSATDKSNLWKIQLAYYLAKDEQLNEFQRDFIVRMINFVNPRMFDLTKGSEEKNAMERTIMNLKVEADNLFSEKKSIKIFSSLASSTESPSMESPSKNTPVTPNLAPGPRDCSCRQGWTSCSSGYSCTNGGQCVATEWGCGLFWYYECNGDCLRCYGC